MPEARSFTGKLEKLPGALGWTVIRLPFDACAAWPERKGMRVQGKIGGFAFRTSLFGLGRGRGQFLLVNREMRKQAALEFGGSAKVVEAALKAAVAGRLAGFRIF